MKRKINNNNNIKATEHYCLTSATNHNKPRPAPYCRVLPPGEFNYMIPETFYRLF